MIAATIFQFQCFNVYFIHPLYTANILIIRNIHSWVLESLFVCRAAKDKSKATFTTFTSDCFACFARTVKRSWNGFTLSQFSM